MYGTLANNLIETIPVGDACAAASGADAASIYYRNSPVDQRSIGADFEVRREFRAGIMASAQYGYIYGRYASSPNSDPSLSQSTVIPFAASTVPQNARSFMFNLTLYR